MKFFGNGIAIARGYAILALGYPLILFHPPGHQCPSAVPGIRPER